MNDPNPLQPRRDASQRLGIPSRFLEDHRMTRGTVKWFSEAMGYGFIEAEGTPDVFVHHTAIEGVGYRTLAEGEAVEFEAVSQSAGARATVVRKPEPRADIDPRG